MSPGFRSAASGLLAALGYRPLVIKDRMILSLITRVRLNARAVGS